MKPAECLYFRLDCKRKQTRRIQSTLIHSIMRNTCLFYIPQFPNKYFQPKWKNPIVIPKPENDEFCRLRVQSHSSLCITIVLGIGGAHVHLIDARQQLQFVLALFFRQSNHFRCVVVCVVCLSTRRWVRLRFGCRLFVHTYAIVHVRMMVGTYPSGYPIAIGEWAEFSRDVELRFGKRSVLHELYMMLENTLKVIHTPHMNIHTLWMYISRICESTNTHSTTREHASNYVRKYMNAVGPYRHHSASASSAFAGSPPKVFQCFRTIPYINNRTHSSRMRERNRASRCEMSSEKPSSTTVTQFRTRADSTNINRFSV